MKILLFLKTFFRVSRDRKNFPGKRILFVCSPATAYGGGQQYLYRVLEGMEKEEWNTLFVYPDFDDADQFKGELTFRSGYGCGIPYRKNKAAILLFLMVATVAFRPHVIHMNGYSPRTRWLLAAAGVARGILGFSICLTSHLDLFSREMEKCIEHTTRIIRWRSPLAHFRWAMSEYYKAKLLLSVTDMMIFVNNYYRKKAQHMLGLHNVPMISIYNGVDTVKFRPRILSQKERQGCRQKMGFKDDDYVVCGIGNLVGQKRFDIFIRAVAQLARHGYPVQGLIIGKGHLNSSLRQLAADEGIVQRVRFDGYCSDIPILLNVVDCFLKSRDWSGSPG